MRARVNSLMLQSWRKPANLYSDFNTPQFASVMGIIIFVVLTIFMTVPTPHGGIGLDLPRVLHPVSMPNASREDAMVVSVTRDNKIYFGVERVSPTDLPQRIACRLKDRDIERKVYIKADARARWAGVKQVLEAVHSAGILRVAFWTDGRYAPTQT